MCLSMSHSKILTITGELDGQWVVEQELPDGRVVIKPADYPAVLTPGTGSELTAEELDAFWAEHGPHMLPADDEG